ncbi:hypothetical protein Q3G72_004079 [Acer saccharum]|nr:hypothetical protein Q3G72_004079 [Acer saccharum]
MAASHGHKHAFLCLHSLCGPGKGYDYSRRNNGETILHCAISGDYFDLAFQIIHSYEKLVNSVNERGFSPLHLLAAKPSAFRSGTYSVYCYVEGIFVDQLQVEKSDHYKSSKPNKDKDKSICPANYETCHYLIRVLLKGIKIVMHRATDCLFNNQGKPLASEAEDHPTQCSFDNEGNPIPILVAEDPPTQCSFDNEWKTIADAENPCEGEEDDVLNSMFKAQGHQLFPPNYSVCFELVKLVSKAILVILGLGSNKIRKIREKKQNNTWSIQVMNELLKRVSMYEYESDGKKPLQPQSQPGVEDAFLEMPPITLAEDASEMSPIPPTSNVSGANQHGNTNRRLQKVPKTRIKQVGFYLIYLADASEMSPIPPTSNVSGANQHGNTNRRLQKVPKTRIKQVENKKEISEMEKIESPILIAAKNGITEIVEKILENFPVALHDMNYEKKNVVLLAVENRQQHVFELLLKKTKKKESVFRNVDHEGNSALHLAARLGDHKPWLIPGAAMGNQVVRLGFVFEMQYVKGSMPFHFFRRYNKASKSPRDVFTETHKELVKSRGDWLTNTSESCSVVAALIATVAFATSSTVPGRIRYQERDFGSNLPRKLLVGLTSLFVSIASMLVSFCSGHFFVLKEQLKFAAVPVYAVTCLPITFFAIAQFPLYFDLNYLGCFQESATA